MEILFFIIGLSILILIHEVGHFLAAKRFGLWVEEFGFGFPPRLFAKKIGETVYSFNLLPLGGFVRIHGEKREEAESEILKKRSFWFLPIGKRAAIVAAGVIMNFLLGWFIISSIYLIGIPKGIAITGVLPDTPAAQIGLQKGDRILGFQSSEEFVKFVNEAQGSEIALKILRGNDTLEFKVSPRPTPPSGEGPLGIVLSEVGFPKEPLFKALGNGLTTSVKILGAILVAIGGFFYGIFSGAPALENFVGPVGIFQIASDAAGFGLMYLLELVGLISLNLVVLNVLPFPALDGGRLFFLLIEKLKGSPLPQKFEIWANALGFALLLLLMIVITVRDVVKLF